ncbi:MAG: energy transducer TonB [Bacteroidales bacterium]|jgi:protein TonB|nr:energy transducer TonB [Bacteroidales bacterium]
MEVKKSSKADLESKSNLFFEIGVVAVLAVLLVFFEWTSKPKNNNLLLGMQGGEVDEEIIPITRQQQEQPPPPPPPPQVIEVINIVEDDVDIEEIDFESMDVDENMAIDFVPFEEEEEAEEEVFFIVEDMPTFQGGGKEKFREYIQQNLNYPPIAAENGISGRVFVQFAVNAKGEVVDVVVVRGVDPALDKEAKRVVQSSPKWVPGKQRGRPVKVQFTFPIVFVLQ